MGVGSASGQPLLSPGEESVIALLVLRKQLNGESRRDLGL